MTGRSSTSTNYKNMRWEVFTQEEKDTIKDLSAKGRFDAIPKAIVINDPEKELELNKYLDEVKPVVDVEDSKVKKEMLNELSKGNDIDSPEKEEEWQAKLDNEKKEKKAKRKTAYSKKEETKKEETK